MPQPSQSWRVRARLRLTDALADAGTFFYDLAAKVDPGPQGEPCPDCGVPTTIPKDQPCPECADIIVEKRREEAIMSSAYEAGYEAATRSREGEGDW